jgi:hypothetical protein
MQFISDIIEIKLTNLGCKIHGRKNVRGTTLFTE